MKAKSKTIKKTSKKTIKKTPSKITGLNPQVFDGVINRPLLHEVITGYQAAKRAGTASTKGRAEVRGGGQKPWRQKGTGRARVGSIRNPIWRGGGIVFGPKPRDFSHNIPKKARRLALKSALCAKLDSDSIIITESLSVNKPKTKLLFKELVKLTKPKKKKLPSMVIVLDSPGENVKKAVANIPDVYLRECHNLNALDALKCDKLVFSKAALDKVCERILKG